MEQREPQGRLAVKAEKGLSEVGKPQQGLGETGEVEQPKGRSDPRVNSTEVTKVRTKGLAASAGTLFGADILFYGFRSQPR